MLLAGTTSPKLIKATSVAEAAAAEGILVLFSRRTCNDKLDFFGSVAYALRNYLIFIFTLFLTKNKN